MKRLIRFAAVALAAVLLGSLCACGDTSQDESGGEYVCVKSTRYVYNDAGLLAKTVNESDVSGNITALRVERYSGSDGLVTVTEYAYERNPQGKIIKQTASNEDTVVSERTYEYDSAGNLIKSTLIPAGASEPSSMTTWSYDENGEVLTSEAYNRFGQKLSLSVLTENLPDNVSRVYMYMDDGTLSGVSVIKNAEYGGRYLPISRISYNGGISDENKSSEETISRDKNGRITSQTMRYFGEDAMTLEAKLTEAKDGGYVVSFEDSVFSEYDKHNNLIRTYSLLPDGTEQIVLESEYEKLPKK